MRTVLFVCLAIGQFFLATKVDSSRLEFELKGQQQGFHFKYRNKIVRLSPSSDEKGPTVDIWDLSQDIPVKQASFLIDIDEYDFILPAKVLSGGYLLVQTLRGRESFYDLEKLQQIHPSGLNIQIPFSAEVSSEEIAGSNGEKVQIWNVPQGKLINEIEDSGIFAIQLDNGLIGVFGEEGINVYNALTGKLVNTVKELSNSKGCSRYFPGKYYALGNGSNSFRIYSLADSSLIADLDINCEEVKFFSVFDNGKIALTSQGSLLIYDSLTNKLVKKIDGVQEFTPYISLSSGYLATIGSNEIDETPSETATINIYDLVNLKLVDSITTSYIPPMAVYSFVYNFDPVQLDNRKLVTVTKDGFQVWSLDL